MSQAWGWLPDELALIPAGPQLAALLAGVDRSALCDDDLVRLAQARQRLAAHLQAQLLADIHTIGQRTGDLVGGSEEDRRGDPQRAARNAKEQVKDRRVVTQLTSEGTAELGGYDLPAQRVAAAMERLTAIARAAKAGGDARKLDQLRADAMLDLLVGEGVATGGAVSGAAEPRPGVLGVLPGPRKGVVDIQVPLTTLLGLSDFPGELAGYGPVVADIARQVVAEQQDSTWRFSVYDSHGQLIHHGITRRRPKADDAAFIRARDRTCRAPGCRRPARQCDIDHTEAWASTKDSRRCNLACLCRRHHLWKHLEHTGLIQSTPGTLGFRTPLGQHIVTHPEPYLDELALTLLNTS